MAILDLQGMQAQTSSGARFGKSGSSKGCNNGGQSGLSLALC